MLKVQALGFRASDLGSRVYGLVQIYLEVQGKCNPIKVGTFNPSFTWDPSVPTIGELL